MPFLSLPAGYTISRSRDGYALHSDHFGEIGEGDFGCWASACYAAHDHADEVADADPVEAEVADRAYNVTLDYFHALASDELTRQGVSAVARGRHRAARALIAAIDGITIAAAAQQKAAA